MKKQKLVEWQKVKELQSNDFESDMNTAGSNAMRLNLMARQVLTDQQFAVYDAVLNKALTFNKISAKLKISVPRISEVWHRSCEIVEKAWSERNVK